ncbi:MAG: T9SS type A sorting domain-containing protein [Bacteroidota bacterium]
MDLPAQLFIDATDRLPEASTGGQTVDAQAVDIDKDGDMDVVLANEFEVNVLLINNGSGRFTDAGPGAIPARVHDSEDIAIADYNRDGHTDIVFVSEDDFEHEYYVNDGNTVFSRASFLPFTSCNAVATADLNRDGAPDLLLGNRGQNMLLINNGLGEFINETPDRLPILADSTHDVKLVDVDNDLDHDIILGNEDGNRLFINNGSGVFSDQSLARLPQNSAIDTRKIVPGDVDMDGDVDLFLATVKFSAGKDPQNRLWINDGNGFFRDVTDEQLPLIPDQAVDGVFTDLNRDRIPDLVVSGVLNQPLKFYINDGQGFFSNRTDDVVGGSQILEDSIDVFSVITADFNLDGFDDLYVCNRAGQDRLFFRDPEARLPSSSSVIDLSSANSLLQLFPNPTQQSFRLSGELSMQLESSVQLFDLMGRQLAEMEPTETGSGHRQYALPSDLAAGTYLLRVRGAGQSYVLRLQQL